MIGIIGGTGLYNIDGLEILEEINVSTPVGEPSAPLVRGAFHGKDIIFLPRHGVNHQFIPSEINYRANIFALKSAGVTQVISVSAVGSLREEIAPGDLIIPTQYFDWTGGNRKKSFFGDGFAAHVSTAEPTCPSLTEAIRLAAEKLQIPMHTGKAYACVEGPRLGTKIESYFLRDAVKCDLVGMTNVPEAFLAREAQLCYATIAIATDYDCWLDDPDRHVTVAMVIERFGTGLEKVNSLLKSLLNGSVPEIQCGCRTSLAEALLTPEDSLNTQQKKLLSVLKI